MTSVSDVKLPSHNKTHIGYKFFDGAGDALFGPFYTPLVHLCTGYPRYKWVADTESWSIQPTLSGEKYPSGFHVYLSVPNTPHTPIIWGDLYVILYKSVVAYGYQGGDAVVVAREMKILKKACDVGFFGMLKLRYQVWRLNDRTRDGKS
jgi:hypothetical protein